MSQRRPVPPSRTSSLFTPNQLSSNSSYPLPSDDKDLDLKTLALQLSTSRNRINNPTTSLLHQVGPCCTNDNIRRSGDNDIIRRSGDDIDVALLPLVSPTTNNNRRDVMYDYSASKVDEGITKGELFSRRAQELLRDLSDECTSTSISIQHNINTNHNHQKEEEVDQRRTKPTRNNYKRTTFTPPRSAHMHLRGGHVPANLLMLPSLVIPPISSFDQTFATPNSIHCKQSNLLLFHVLPPEIHIVIFEFLPVAGVIRIGLVCKRFQILAAKQYLWEKIYHRCNMQQQQPLVNIGESTRDAPPHIPNYKMLVQAYIVNKSQQVSSDLQLVERQFRNVEQRLFEHSRLTTNSNSFHGSSSREGPPHSSRSTHEHARNIVLPPVITSELSLESKMDNLRMTIQTLKAVHDRDSAAHREITKTLRDSCTELKSELARIQESATIEKFEERCCRRILQLCPEHNTKKDDGTIIPITIRQNMKSFAELDTLLLILQLGAIEGTPRNDFKLLLQYRWCRFKTLFPLTEEYYSMKQRARISITDNKNVPIQKKVGPGKDVRSPARVKAAQQREATIITLMGRIMESSDVEFAEYVK